MYEITQLFWNKPVFMLELIIAELLFVYSLKRRKKFLLRAIVSILACFAFAFAFPIVSYDAAYVSFMFFSMFFFTVLMMKFCFNESWTFIIFCCIAGYTVQHIAYQFHTLFLTVLNIESSMILTHGYGSEEGGFVFNPFLILVYLFFYGVTYWFLFMMLGSRIKKEENLRLKSLAMLMLVALIIFVDIVMNLVIVYHAGGNINRIVQVAVCLYNIMCCILTLSIQFELSTRKRLEKELSIEKQFRYLEKQQYLISKENIELINMKCHDLKHQIRMIGNSGLERQEVIEQIENVISIYDSAVKTGNEALDIILTEKSLLCNKNGIKLSCIADGEKLCFMSGEDIYSLFGNIIDNAIEAVINLENEKRIVGLAVRNTGKLVSVNVHNYYDNIINFENGLPQTTKADKNYHGFGLKSIQYVCKKYNADLSINADNNVFNINILFPL